MPGGGETRAVRSILPRFDNGRQARLVGPRKIKLPYGSGKCNKATMNQKPVYLLAVILLAGLILFLTFRKMNENPDWLGQEYIITNGIVTVRVAPHIGRISGYYRNGEANWLAMAKAPISARDPWPSYPGEKIWPAAQFLWMQIHGTDGPDPVFDKSPWQVVEKKDLSLTLVSEVSPHLGIRMSRTIVLTPGSTRVENHFTVERLSRSAHPVCVWTVSSCVMGDYILMQNDLRVGHARSIPYHTFTQPEFPRPNVEMLEYPLENVELLENRHYLQFKWPESGGAKAGTYGVWIALVRGNTAFRQEIQYDPEACFLECSNLQAWAAAKAGFCEIETSSPHWWLRVGEKAVWSVRWDLVDFPAYAIDPVRQGHFLNRYGD